MSSKIAMIRQSERPTIRLTAILEAPIVTGPVRNLLQFCEIARGLPDGPRLAVTLATFLRRSGKPADGPPNEFVEAARQNGISIHCIDERSAFDVTVIGALRDLVRKTQPHIIQTHAVKSHFLIRLSGLWKTLPWVAFHHGYTAESARDLAYNQFDRWSLRPPAHIVAVSHAALAQLTAKGVDTSQALVLHNAIDAAWIAGIDSSASMKLLMERHGNIAADEVIVLGIGRLSKEKAFIDLVAAMAQLVRLRPALPVRLLILGEGPEQSSIERAIQRAGLENVITLAGRVRDVRPYYRVARLVAIPSLSEGSPNVLLEAMLAGIPIVATTAGGIPEIVQHEHSALLVPPRDTAGLARAMASVLEDTELARRLTRNAQLTISQKYLPDGRARILGNFYERLYYESGNT